MEPPADGGLKDGASQVHGELTNDLVGRSFEYVYESGISYRLSFPDETYVKFDILATPDGGPIPPPLGPDGKPLGDQPFMQYRARKLRENQYYVHWMVPRLVHVALVIDLELDTISVAAMMPPNQWEFFDQAHIAVKSEL